MQCGELIYRKVTIMTQEADSVDSKPKKPEKETIHSGHFMVSEFELEAQDDDDLVAVPVPEEEGRTSLPNTVGVTVQISRLNTKERAAQQLSIDSSLSKLFQCMSLAYRQKLTSPKWNRFKGIRLRWKDKIRLNNVIWRCWHMQFIRKQNTLVCQFASPLDVNMHDKPEAVVLEGKYWKRKLAAVTAEYKKWRMFYRSRTMGLSPRDGNDMLTDMFDWQPHSNDSVHSVGSMMVDEDYMEFMSDTLFSTISANQPFAFPDPREISRNAGIADFIQPSLVQLQPNLEDFMDTLEPLQDLLTAKLPSVPEEYIMPDDIFRGRSMEGSEYNDLDLLTVQQQVATAAQTQVSQTQPQQQSASSQLQYTATIFAQAETNNNFRPSGPSAFQQVAGQTTYEDASSVGKVRPLRPSQRTHPHHQQTQQQKQSQPSASLPQQSSAIFQQPPPPPPPPQTQHSQQQQQVVLNPSAQYQVFSMNELGSATSSPSHSPPSRPPPPPQPPGYPLSASYKQPSSQQSSYQRTSSQQQVSFPNFRLPSPPLAASQSPTPSPDSSSLRQSLGTASPTLKSPSLRSNSLPGPQDDTFVMPKYNQLKQRNRSRSGSSLVSAGAQQRQHPPPLVSHASDPALATPLSLVTPNSTSPTTSTSTLQPLLAQLLTTNSMGVYNFTGTSDKGIGRTQSVVPILPAPSPASTQPAATALLITTSTPVTVGQSIPHTSSQLLLGPLGGGGCNKGTDSPSDSSAVASPVGLNLSPLASPLNMAPVGSPGPLSPPKSGSLHSRANIDQRAQSRRKMNTPQKDRRTCHINAEQKRRCNIKNGFDMLHSLIPQLHQNPNAKLSKAAMLQKGADYIRQLRAERAQLRDEMESLRQQIECLNTAISNCQAMLPATGAPVSRQRASKIREMFDEYVRVRTLENWKFWIFSILLEPLLASYNASVSTASLEDLFRSTLLWVEQHCSLVDLRPAVLNSLRYLCTATEILTDPSRLPEEARQAVIKQQDQRHNGAH
ncbi:carbohydrate-responsive element-binding protein isoform X2 [Periplaneta americana]|uniref:carbohydrate-responsive element-binding protein isoform X2 n=1 Tax=Periplaneta americana TaxID=6978 RepID=UPI0037E99636